MTAKQEVLRRFPEARATSDLDGFWWVRDVACLAALNDPRHPVRSAAAAWAKAAERLKPHNDRIQPRR
jgi:hypothetical protein